VSEDANSGIFIRCRDRNKITADTCYEVNIYDKAPDPAFGTGSIVRFATVKPVHKAGGQWNVYEITARGSKITATLNGERTVELDNKKFKSGVIALQYAAGTVKFRKVMIRAL
jgi:predicted MarR family transcription regulator